MLTAYCNFTLIIHSLQFCVIHISLLAIVLCVCNDVTDQVAFTQSCHVWQEYLCCLGLPWLSACLASPPACMLFALQCWHTSVWTSAPGCCWHEVSGLGGNTCRAQRWQMYWAKPSWLAKGCLSKPVARSVLSKLTNKQTTAKKKTKLLSASFYIPLVENTTCFKNKLLLGE